MPRVRARTTTFRSYSEKTLAEAIEKVREKQYSPNTASKNYGIPKSTLRRYLMKSESNISTVNYRPRCEHLKVFTANEERKLKGYFEHASHIHHGLTSKQARRLVYDFALIKNKKLKPNWAKEKQAGKEWLTSFAKRCNISLRVPKKISLKGTTNHSKRFVDVFCESFINITKKFNFSSKDIFNIDETIVMTIHKAPKIIVSTGKKVVSQVAYCTVAAIVSAAGKSIPPFVVFPQGYYEEDMMHNGPNGLKGTATPTGLMNDEIFLSILKHFVEFERPSLSNPKLIIIDNHESHLSVLILEFAKANGIIMLTLPPYCKHELQPLGISVFGQFKKAFTMVYEKWKTRNPNDFLKFYDLPELIEQAFALSFTSQNICNGFRLSGISPFAPNVFLSKSHLNSIVTHKPVSLLVESTESFYDLESTSIKLETDLYDMESAQIKSDLFITDNFHDDNNDPDNEFESCYSLNSDECIILIVK